MNVNVNVNVNDVGRRYMACTLILANREMTHDVRWHSRDGVVVGVMVRVSYSWSAEESGGVDKQNKRLNTETKTACS